MLDCQKDQFDLDPAVHYLNCAYMSPLSRAVQAAGVKGIQRKANPHQIGPDDFFAESDQARALFAELVHVPDAQHIALLPAASYGLAIAARNTPIERGQNIVVLHEQFPSNMYTWMRLAERGATVQTVMPPEGPENRAQRWNERILDAITPKTAVVTLPQVHWTDGVLFDLESIGARARDVGAALVVDGTQSVGAFPFDVQKIKPDALICAGYKWLLAPYSTGLAYFGERYREGIPLEENWITRLGSENFSGLVAYESQYQPGAIRYDVGERSNFILVPMLIAGLNHVLSWGVGNIQQYCKTLVDSTLHDIGQWGYQMAAPDERGAHLFGIRFPDHVDVLAVKETLMARNISVSVRGSALRVAPHVYNDAADVQALRETLETLAQ